MPRSSNRYQRQGTALPCTLVIVDSLDQAPDYMLKDRRVQHVWASDHKRFDLALDAVETAFDSRVFGQRVETVIFVWDQFKQNIFANKIANLAVAINKWEINDYRAETVVGDGMGNFKWVKDVPPAATRWHKLVKIVTRRLFGGE